MNRTETLGLLVLLIGLSVPLFVPASALPDLDAATLLPGASIKDAHLSFMEEVTRFCDRQKQDSENLIERSVVLLGLGLFGIGCWRLKRDRVIEPRELRGRWSARRWAAFAGI